MDIRILAPAFLFIFTSICACQTTKPPPEQHAIACDTSGETPGACAYVETDAQRRLYGTRPEYDVAQQCQAMSNLVGNDRLGLIKASCMDAELAARARIAAMTIPTDVFDRCEKEGETPRGGSYLDFERCANAAVGLSTPPAGGRASRT